MSTLFLRNTLRFQPKQEPEDPIFPMKFTERYVLESKLGAGGMGSVYRTVDRLTGQQVALKRLMVTFDLEISDIMRTALAQEFQTLASIRHPNVISVLDYGFDNDRQPFFTMELVEKAHPLDEYAQYVGPDERVKLFIQMLEALTYLHQRGILHRDIKPNNVLVQGDRVVLIDFGLALEYMAVDNTIPDDEDEWNAPVGTLAYLSPELLQGTNPTRASDLYAVGVTMFEAITGQLPYPATRPEQLLMQVLNQEPRVAMIEDRKMRMIVARLLAKDPLERFSDAYAVVEALYQTLDLPIPSESPAIRDSFLQAASFVGREAEMAALKTSLDALFNFEPKPAPESIAKSKPRIKMPEDDDIFDDDEEVEAESNLRSWLVMGESGVGKSRLLDEFRIYALVQGATVVRGQELEGGGLPYQLWRASVPPLLLSVELNDLEASTLKMIVPNISKLLGRPVDDAPELTIKAAEERLSFTLTKILRRQQKPIVILLEDLHWTIESLGPLRTLLRNMEHLPVMVVATVRIDERPDIADELKEMRVMPLERLTEQEVARLSSMMLGEVGTMPEVLDLLIKETEGNVFFLIEVIRALAETAGSLRDVGSIALPRSVFAGGIQAVIQRRLDQIPARYTTWVRLAALAGRQVDVDLLMHAFVTDQRGLDNFLLTAANAAVIEYKDGMYQFSHDKLREAVVSQIDLDERPALHQRVAEAIEAVYPNETDIYAEKLFEHWHRANQPDKETFYSTIISLMVVEELIEVSALYDHAQMLLGRLIETIEQRPDATSYHTKALRLLGDTYERTGDTPNAMHYYQESLALSQDSGDLRGQAWALINLTQMATVAGQLEAAELYARDSLHLCEANADRQGTAQNLHNLGVIALAQDDADAAENFFTRSRDIFDAIGDRQGLANSVTGLGQVHFNRGEYSAAREYYDRSLEIYHSVGSRYGIGLSFAHLAWVHLALEYFDEARNALLQGLSIASDYDLVEIQIRLLTAAVLLRLREEAYEQAALWVGLILNHPSTDAARKTELNMLLLGLADHIDKAPLQDLLSEGASLDLHDTIRQLLIEMDQQMASW